MLPEWSESGFLNSLSELSPSLNVGRFVFTESFKCHLAELHTDDRRKTYILKLTPHAVYSRARCPKPSSSSQNWRRQSSGN